MIRILHLSDLHISGNVGCYMPPPISGLAAAEVDALRQLEQSARCGAALDDTHCVVSGDLSGRGEASELTVALTYLQQRLQVMRGVDVGLEYKDGSFDAVLGNHDIWGGQSSLLAWFQPNYKKRQALRFLTAGFPQRWQCTGGANYYDVGRIRVRGYLLDSTLPGLRNCFARGRISQKQLDDLDDMVEEDANEDRQAKVEACLRIAVFHHPIRSVEGHRMTMLLEGAPAVYRSLAKRRFGMVLCGHEHSQSITALTNNGTTYQCIGGSATQTTKARDPNAFVLYQIRDNAGDPRPACVVDAQVFERSGATGVPFRLKGTQSLEPTLAMPP